MREVGKAKKGDLNGHFAGEQRDAVSPLVRFLVNARQVADAEEGRALNNDGTAVIERHADTEAYPAVMQRVQGNGHHGNGHAGENGNGAASLAPAMEPQQDADLFGDPIAPEPANGTETALGLEPASSGDTVHDTPLAPEPAGQPELAASPEPEMQPLSLDATEPGMTLDSPAADTVFDQRIEPEAAPDTVYSPPLKPAAPSDIAPAPRAAADTEAQTRVMSPKDLKARAAELVPEELKLETGPIAKLSPDDDILKDDSDEETSAAKKGDEPEKITTKVEPKPAAPAQPGQVVRDTVNFYNQTMALRDLMEANARPAPNITPIATQKLPGPLDKPGVPIATHKIPAPPEIAARQNMPANQKPSSPALAPLAPQAGSLEPAGPQPEPDAQDEQTRAFMRDDLAPAADEPVEALAEPAPKATPALTPSLAEPPSLDTLEAPRLDDVEPEPDESDSTATREVRALAEAPSLAASEDHEEADRKDTDRFNLADLRPADLPPPEGTDKIDKSALEAQSDEPMRVADEDVAARRDTQRFFVSDLVGVATFKPAPKPVPLADDSADRDMTSSGSTTGLEASLDKTSLGEEDERAPRQPLPAPAHVTADFGKPAQSSGTRIIPEYGVPPALNKVDVAPAASQARTGSGRLRASDSQSGEKITEKVKQQEPAASTDTDKIPTPGSGADETSADSPVKKITDALTRRLRAEREETRKLIEEAEGVLLRLRQTPVSARQPRVEAPQETPDSEAPGAAATAISPASPAHIDDTEPQPSAEPEEVFAGLPPLEDIASATIHDLRLAEELLQTSKALAQRKPPSGRSAPVGEPQPMLPREGDSRRREVVRDVGITGGNGNSARHESAAEPDTDPLRRIEARLGGAATRIDEILSSTSAALQRVTGALTREEFEERKRERSGESRPLSLGKVLSGRAAPVAEDDDPYASMSLAELVTASSRREAVAEEIPEAAPRTRSGRRILEDEPLSRRTSAKLASSSLSDDLSKLLAEAAKSTRMPSAPKMEKVPAAESDFELTEGPLWQSLLGIAGVSAFLVALFVWVWFLIASRGA